MDDAHSPDASLLTRMAQRDSKALDIFYTRHARVAFSLALTMLGDHTRATNLTQDVFLLVWRSTRAYQLTNSARSWLLRLTWNRTIDELRRDRWRLASESTAAGAALPCSAGAARLDRCGRTPNRVGRDGGLDHGIGHLASMSPQKNE